MSGAGPATTEETASSIIQPADSSIQSDLSSVEFVLKVVIHHGLAFKLSDSFGVFVVGTVYRADMAAFASAIAQYWAQAAPLQAYAGMQIGLNGQDKFYLADG